MCDDGYQGWVKLYGLDLKKRKIPLILLFTKRRGNFHPQYFWCN